jgi:hypothetical protein
VRHAPAPLGVSLRATIKLERQGLLRPLREMGHEVGNFREESTPQTFGRYRTFGGSSRAGPLVMIVASRGLGASACGVPAPPARGEMPPAPAQLIASYALRAVLATSETRFHVRRVEPGAWPGVAANPGSLSLSPQSPGSLLLDIGQATSGQDACASSFLDESLGTDESSR